MFVAQVRNTLRAEQVHFDGRIERGVEADGGSGVNDNICAQPELEVISRQSQAVGANVARNCLDPSFAMLVESILAHLVTNAVEGVILQNVSCDASAGAASARPDEEYELSLIHI